MSGYLQYIILMLTMSVCNICDAQQTSVAYADSRVRVVSPISINKTTDMDFGNVAVSSQSGGTVVLTPGGTRISTGGVTLPTTTGSPQAASFNVIGENNYSYVITLPSAATLSDGLGHTMILSSFTSNPSGVGTLNSGTQNLSIGATLSVNPAQQEGNYSTLSGGSSINVTVNYN